MRKHWGILAGPPFPFQKSDLTLDSKQMFALSVPLFQRKGVAIKADRGQVCSLLHASPHSWHLGTARKKVWFTGNQGEFPVNPFSGASEPSPSEARIPDPHTVRPPRPDFTPARLLQRLSLAGNQRCTLK